MCELSTDAIIGTDTLGSILPHTLDIKKGLLFTEGGVSERGGTGGSATTDGQKAARRQWLADRDLGMLVLHGVIFGTPDGISSSGV